MTQPDVDHAPPQDLNSEGALLGAVLSPDRHDPHSDFDLDALRAIVSPAMFALREYGEVWQAIIDGADADEPVGDRAAVLSTRR